MDAARALAPMFVFMLTPLAIPVVVELVGRLSDGIRRRSGPKRRAVRPVRRAKGSRLRIG